MRSCNGCTVCCVVPAVPELAKPINKTCVFCSKGCAIYPSRPKSCREYNCAWLLGELPGWMKPNKIHLLVEKLPGGKIVLALAEPGHEKVWRTPQVDKSLKEIYQNNGVAVVASDQFALIPDGQTAEAVMDEVRRFANSVRVA